MKTFERNKLATQAQDVEKEVLFRSEQEKIAMSLNTESEIAAGLIIQRLTELYERPIEASVRETVSNALDAVAVSYSGDEPVVKITTPTVLSPIFEVEDNGVGMSYEDITNVYAKYGSSTKADDFDQIGAYGLGAKSPLAYGNEFTVTSVRDGEKSTIIVAREDYTNYIKVVSVENTDENSGTKISIPVKKDDVDEFVEAIDNYKEVPTDVKIEIDGEVTSNENLLLVADDVEIYDDVKARLWVNKERIRQIQDDMIRFKGDILKSGNIKFGLGGWIYDNPHTEYYTYQNRGITVLVELKPGIVSFNSSRDAIIPNERSRALMLRIENYILTRLEDDLIDTIRDNDKMLKEYIGRYVDERDGVKVNSHKEIEVQGTDKNITDFTNERFDLNAALEKIEKFDGSILAAYSEQKNAYSEQFSNSLLRIGSVKWGYWFTTSSISDINEYIANKFDEGVSDISSQLTMIGLFGKIYGVSSSSAHNSLTVIAEVNEDNLSKLRRNRKAINRLSYDKNGKTMSTNTLVTTYSKEDIIEILSHIGFEDAVDYYEVYTVEEVDSHIKALRRKSSPKKAKKTKQKFYAYVTEYTISNDVTNTNRIEDPEDYEPNDNTFVVLTNSKKSFGYRNIHNAERIMIGISNKHNLPLEEITLVIAVRGSFSSYEVKTFMEWGKTYEFKLDDSDLSRAKIYHDTVKGQKAPMASISKMSAGELYNQHVTLYILHSIMGNDLDTSLNENIKEFNQIASIIGLPVLPLRRYRFLTQLKHASYKGVEVGSWGNDKIWSLHDDVRESALSLPKVYKDLVTAYTLNVRRYYGRHMVTYIGDEGIVSTLGTDMMPTISFPEYAENAMNGPEMIKELYIDGQKKIYDNMLHLIELLNEMEDEYEQGA